MKTNPFAMLRRGRGSRAGVTLAEVMLATSILAVITVLSAEMISGVSKVWLSGRGKSESFATARALLNRIRIDLESGVWRPDVAGCLNPRSNAARDLKFCARVRSPGQDSESTDSSNYRQLTDVYYYLKNEGRDMGYVIRADVPLEWNKSPFKDNPANAEDTKRRLCGNILGFKHRFVLAEGEESDVASTNTVGAVRISLAVADQVTFRLLESAGLAQQAMQRFRSLEPEDWEKEPLAADSTLPAAARQGIRIFHQAVPVVIQKVEGR